MFRIGFDIGSTTAKMVVLDENGNIVFSKYERHNAKVKETVISFLKELLSQVGDEEISIRITGSIGMGVSEKCAISFVQEVVAAAKAIQKDHPAMASMIDIGGEDAKVVFFKDGEPTDLRMNGICAGGTGAFIDQMAIILGVDVNELNALAMHADQVYPIASRCGVFCKTDIRRYDCIVFIFLHKSIDDCMGYTPAVCRDMEKFYFLLRKHLVETSAELIFIGKF